MRVIYIAGPLGADCPEGIAENIRMAELLGSIAAKWGYAPIVVHSNAERLYGQDGDPLARDRGITADLAIVRVVAQEAGGLWIRLRPDGSLSTGTGKELQDFLLAGGNPKHLLFWTDAQIFLAQTSTERPNGLA